MSKQGRPHRAPALPPASAAGRFSLLVLLYGSLALLGVRAAYASVADFQYDQVLRLSLSFFEVQMSGALPDWSFARAWRRDSHLGDKLNDSVPLTGGWYTDGGHLKSSLTIASSASLMAFAALTWGDSIRTINTTPDVGDRNDTAAWDQLLRNLDWAADYLHRCATAGGSGTFVAQVGDHYTEDSYWGAPEDEPASTFRPIWVVRDSNREGADVVSQAVAALTGVGLLLQRSSPGRWPAERAQRYLDKADELWAWGQNLDSVWQAPEGNITVTGYTYSDDKAWAAAWLCKRAILTNGTNAEAVCNEAADMWGDYIMREGVLTTDNWAAAALLLLRDTGAGGLTERYMAGLRGRYLHRWVAAGPNTSSLPKPACNPCLPPAGGLCEAPGGLALFEGPAPAYYTAAMAFVALAAAEDPADPAEARRWQCWAKGQVDWLLGNNPAKQALVTGLEDAPGFSGITVPEQPHHRGSACMGGVCAPRGQPNPRPLPGALLAGPQRDGTVADSRDNGPYSFVSIEYNAAFAAALMGLTALRKYWAEASTDWNAFCPGDPASPSSPPPPPSPLPPAPPGRAEDPPVIGMSAQCGGVVGSTDNIQENGICRGVTVSCPWMTGWGSIDVIYRLVYGFADGTFSIGESAMQLPCYSTTYNLPQLYIEFGSPVNLNESTFLVLQQRNLSSSCRDVWVNVASIRSFGSNNVTSFVFLNTVPSAQCPSPPSPPPSPPSPPSPPHPSPLPATPRAPPPSPSTAGPSLTGGADPGCLPGVDIAGENVDIIYPTTSWACRDSCENDARCTHSVFTAVGICYLKNTPLTGTKGNNTVTTNVVQTCWRGSNAGDAGCVSGIDIRGTDLASAYTASREECRQLCERTPGCVFNVRRTSGWCSLKTDPFTGPDGLNRPTATDVDQLCWSIWWRIEQRLESAACGALAETYGMRPTVSSGTMPVPLRNLYDANECDLKVCLYLYDKYGPLSSNNLNKLPVDWQSTWKNVSCDNVVAQCPTLAGYLSSFGDDHHGDDIGNDETSAAATCAANKLCWGYNGNGWMKITGIPNVHSSNLCWRIKISTAMLDAQGCWQYAQSYPDFVPGFTFGSAPYDSWDLWLDSDCDRRICAYFAARFGVVAANNSSQQEASSWANLPDKYKASWRVLYCNDVLGGWSSSCPAVPGYVGTPDVDHLMDELGYYPYNTSAACTANAACNGFSSIGFTKSSASPNTVRPGSCWYSKLS